MKQVTTKIDEVQFAALQGKAEAAGSTVSSIIRDAVAAYFSPPTSVSESCLDEIRALAMLNLAAQKDRSKTLEERLAEVVHQTPRMVQFIKEIENE